ncbi:UDP-N-acetylmuramoylalanine--D-glutamate ligase [Alphaproteobacteria bacterium]|nr:UDP-N-acetylmuramoylalanine--D-glutamate ligase [Alphaproteobacteria bacterium]
MFSSKKGVLVVGYGVSGKAAFEFLRNNGHDVLLFDDGKIDVPNRVTAINWTAIDLIVKSPSVPCFGSNCHKIIREANERSLPVLSVFDVFKLYNPAARMVAITGTNGKSTTTALVYHILKNSNFSAAIGGNIGIPYFSMPKSDIYVLEMSSYELTSSKYLDFEISCVLNIDPDHLQFHLTFSNYIAAKHLALDHAKIKIFSIEDKLTTSKYSFNENAIRISIANIPEANYYVREGVLIDSGEAVIDLSNLEELRGAHNHQNVLCAYAICRKFGLPPKEIALSIASFKALPHRMKIVKRIGNVLFVNDSKGTNPVSSAKALATFVGHKIFWLAGGRSKKIEPLPFVSHYLQGVHKIYLFGEAEDEFDNIFKSYAKTAKCGSMESALNAAFIESMKMEDLSVILFSPMGTSFDQFANFEERGDKFISLVNKLLIETIYDCNCD